MEKKKGKNAKAGRPLVNSHIQRALKIIPNVGYETRCYKKGHCPQQLSLLFLPKQQPMQSYPFFPSF